MADGRHFEKALSPYLSRELSDFDQIWYAYANFHSEDGYLTKIEVFSNSRWRTDAILKIGFWLYLGAILADLCKFRSGDETRVGTIVPRVGTMVPNLVKIKEPITNAHNSQQEHNA